MSEPDIAKIWRGAKLAMRASVEGMDHIAYGYCGWIKHHCEELLYEDMYALDTAAPDKPEDAERERDG